MYGNLKSGMRPLGHPESKTLAATKERSPPIAHQQISSHGIFWYERDKVSEFMEFMHIVLIQIELNEILS
jgi:hypothetical protein